MAAYKPWNDKSFLYKMYVTDRKTIDQIADECKKMGYSVTPMTIYNGLKKFDMIKNSRNLGKRKVTSSTPRRKGYYG